MSARVMLYYVFFFQAEDGIRDWSVTGVQTCALPICNHRSKPADLVLREIGQLLEQGVQEVVLVGQDTTRYGHDRGERDGLARLLERIKIGRASCRERVWISGGGV